MKYIALIEVNQLESLGPQNCTLVHRFDAINANAFVSQWNQGAQAVLDWKIFCDALFNALTDTGLLTEKGFDIEGYDVGSFIKVFLDNQGRLPQGVQDSIIFGIVLSALKQARKMPGMKKGREISVDMPKLLATLDPVTPVIVRQMEVDKTRKDMFTYAIDQLKLSFTQKTPTWNQ